MQAYCRSMNIHMNEDYIHVSSTARQSQMVRQEHKGIRENVIHFAMSLPEISILKVVRILIRS